MTLLFMDGLQDPILIPKPEWDVIQPWNSAVTGRDGVSNSAARAVSSGTLFKTLTLPSAAATVICGFSFKQDNTGGFGNTNAGAFPLGGYCVGGVVQLVLTLNSGGFIEARKGTTVAASVIATSSGHAAIAPGTWHSYEVKYLAHATTGTLIVRLDGVTVLSISGVSTAATGGSVNQIQFGTGVIGTQNAQWDDMYVCDAVNATATQGRPNNDFLGDVRIATLVPTAAGDTTGWTPSTGSNYACVDENPANTTDYVSASASSTGTRDLYNITDLSGSISAVIAVRTHFYVSKSDAGTALVKPALKENGVITADAAGLALSVSWGGMHGLLRCTRPSDGGAWTVSDINSLQVGMDVA